MDNPRIVLSCASIVLLISLSAGCAPKQQKESEMGELSSAVTKLTKNVEGTVRWTNPPLPPDISDSELLAKSTEHDPEIMKFFQNYTVRIKHNNKDALVLICTKDQKQALFEDAGCTAKLDWILWNEQPQLKCEFTTTVENACPQK
jgi:hypothetical protein